MGQARNRGSREARIAEKLSRFGIKQLTPERYNAFVSWTRSPIAAFVGEELEFFSTLDEVIIGVVLRDVADRDFAFVTLGRDEKGRFRAIDVDASCSSRAIARHRLFSNMEQHGKTGRTSFPQGEEDTDGAGIDLFAPKLAEDRLDSYFKILRDEPSWFPARSMMSEMMKHYVDVDGNFVEQFQSTGFDSRVWELYLYAALLESGLYVEKPSPAPDFSVFDGSNRVFIEAVIVGPTGGARRVEAPERSEEELQRLLTSKIPIKFGSALYSKLNKSKPYWEMDHVREKPLVFAIADFHEAQAMTWTGSALWQYLYGIAHDFSHDEDGRLEITPKKVASHDYEGKSIPSGFFLLPRSENISAVLFTPSGTIAKFNRMGMLAGFAAPNQVMWRKGWRHDHDPNAFRPALFEHEVRQGIVTETWSEGLSMFHNPHAKHPVSPTMFPGIAHHFYRDGQIESFIPEFHPYSSMTIHVIPKG